MFRALYNTAYLQFLSSHNTVAFLFALMLNEKLRGIANLSDYHYLPSTNTARCHGISLELDLPPGLWAGERSFSTVGLPTQTWLFDLQM
ncbi:MAG: hypothetical protein R2867_27125 [Caldilineaceae bacterium]